MNLSSFLVRVNRSKIRRGGVRKVAWAFSALLVVSLIISSIISSGNGRVAYADDKLSRITVTAGEGVCPGTIGLRQDGEMLAYYQGKKIEVCYNIVPQNNRMPAKDPEMKLFFGKQSVRPSEDLFCQNVQRPGPIKIEGVTGKKITLVGKWEKYTVRNDTWRRFTAYEIHAPASADNAYGSQGIQRENASGGKQNVQNQSPQGQTKQDFLKRYGASELVQLGDLQSNPFRYEGKVVAVPCAFAQMLSKDVALFATGFGAMGIASGAPATRFKGGDGVILIGKVVGQKQIDPGGGWGQMMVPNIKFQDAYSCGNSDTCNGILGP